MSKIVPSVILLVFLMFAILSSNAATFTCDSKVFVGGERVGASWREIQDACGEPVSQSTTQWVYIQDGIRYILSFSGAGLLTNINSAPAR